MSGYLLILVLFMPMGRARHASGSGGDGGPGTGTGPAPAWYHGDMRGPVRYWLLLCLGALALLLCRLAELMPVLRERRAGAVFALSAGVAMQRALRDSKRPTAPALGALGWMERGPWEAAEAGDRIV
jgi:hypothetical protein